MNGRALNEKAIEVSPSSARVLDRAADILTPFPPSKNRPRPGDWTCPSCGFSNFQRRTACFRCSYPAMGAGPSGDGMGYGYGYGPHNVMGGHHHMGHGHGMPHMGGRGGGGIVPFRAGDWKCGSEGCGYHNFAKNVSCLRCGAPRSSAAVVADSSFNSNMDNSSGYGMHGPTMGGGPGAGAYGGGGPGGYGSGGGYQSQQYGGPPSTYGLPSSVAASNAPYSGMGSGMYGNNNGQHSAAAYDNRQSQEHSYSSAGQSSATMGQANGGGHYGGFDNQNDPFSFLNTSLGSLTIDDSRRNGAASTAKSPT